MRRSRSRSHSPPIPQFPLIISFAAILYDEEISQLKFEIIKKFDIDRLHISDEVNIGDDAVRFIYIYSHSLRAKIDSLKLILEALFPERNSGEISFSFQNPIDPVIISKILAKNHGINAQVLPEMKGFSENVARGSARPRARQDS